MLLNIISPSNIFTHFSEASLTVTKSENVSTNPINIRINSKKNRRILNRIITVNCFQKPAQEEEKSSKTKKPALAEWLSSTKRVTEVPSSSPAPPFKSVGAPSTPSRPSVNLKNSAFTPSSRAWTRRSHGESTKPYEKASKIREPASWMPKKPDPKATAVTWPVHKTLPKSLEKTEACFMDVKTRDKILGEPLTNEEVKQLIDSSCHNYRRLNIGRDGLTHNLLENIHAQWKRRCVCTIKCKGVVTVDMDNVCNQLEDKTGGKVIHRAGGAVYLFRGRNYNYKTRSMFPMMLSKPAAAVDPTLIEHAAEGLTIEEANELRTKGRSLLPICKLEKNGVYLNLVKDVRDAFEVSDLVCVDCQGLKSSDYKKIGAKLKDLVPCVLLSFECEHILMWRGKDWKLNEQGAGAPEVHSDKECSVADSVKNTTRYTAMTTFSLDEKSGYEIPLSDCTDALTKENVLASNSLPFENVADEPSGDKDEIPEDLAKSTSLQILVKNAKDSRGEENALKDNSVAFENVVNEALCDKEGITAYLEKSTGQQHFDFVKNADDTSGGEVDSLEDKLGTSFSSEDELLDLIKSNEMEIFSDKVLTADVSVSVTNRDTQCLGEDSAYNFKTTSSSMLELEELVESTEMKVFSDGELDSSVSVSSTNTDEQCLGRDSAYSSETSDVPFFYRGEVATISASKQISEGCNALSKTVDGISYNHTDLISDSSKRLTDSFSPAAEMSMVGEELAESTDGESILHSDEESKLYVQSDYAQETNGQENDDLFNDVDGKELIASSNSETSQGGVGLHIEVFWEQEIDSGRVLLLDESAADPDIVHEKAVAFAKTAPAGPFFKRKISRKKVIKKTWKKQSEVKANES